MKNYGVFIALDFGKEIQRPQSLDGIELVPDEVYLQNIPNSKTVLDDYSILKELGYGLNKTWPVALDQIENFAYVVASEKAPKIIHYMEPISGVKMRKQLAFAF